MVEGSSHVCVDICCRNFVSKCQFWEGLIVGFMRDRISK